MANKEEDGAGAGCTAGPKPGERSGPPDERERA